MIRFEFQAETVEEVVSQMLKLANALSETDDEPKTKAPAKKPAAKKAAPAPKEEAETESEPEKAEEPEQETAPEYTEADVRKRFIALQDSGPEGAKGMMELLVELGAVNEDKLPKLKALSADKYAEAIEKAEALLEKVGANTSVFGD